MLLYERVAAALRMQMARGTLCAGERLPSIRRLAEDHGVSVATAVQTYLQLEREGLVVARPRSGYFVRATPPPLPASPPARRRVPGHVNNPALRDATAAPAMHDANAAAELLEAFGLPSTQEIKSQLQSGESSNTLWLDMLKKIETVIPIRYPATVGGCFVAGTPVWTDKGLVSIERLKVGDLVLSQPEETGERSYRRVVKTIVHENKAVRLISIYDERTDAYQTLYATDNHPFWVNGIGWTQAADLESGQYCQLADGSPGVVYQNLYVHRTHKKNTGWVGRHIEDFGSDIIFRDGEIAAGNNRVLLPDDIEFSDNPYFTTHVYNIEVEETHTYYVGEAGVWVHNTGPAPEI